MTADDLQGRVALVTGGASGIGAATVTLLREHGATVIPADLRPGDGVEVLDVSDEVAVDAFVASIVERHGRLDLAANVAGTPGVHANIAESTTAAWRQTMAVNLDGVYFCVRAELRAMRATGAGSIVNVRSEERRVGKECRL